MEKQISADKQATPLFDLEEQFIADFEGKVYSEIRLSVIFAVAVILEMVLLAVFIPVFIQNALFAFMIAIFVLTLYGYLMLRQYLNAQNIASFELLVKNLLLNAEKHVHSAEDTLEHRFELSKLCCRLADRLYLREYRFLNLPPLLSFLRPWNESLSCWLHWRDVQEIREQLLRAAVNQHLELVRANPTDPDAHALLANAYVMLSGLYLDPHKLGPEMDERWVPSGKKGDEMEAKFKLTAEKAIEEFKILKDYAPNDPWIHMQLAYSYRELQMPSEEKAAYETILTLRPQDHDTRFKLGALYFQRGENARGLKVYEELKNAQYTQADKLLEQYGKG